MKDHEGKPTDGRGLREKLWGKPGDPSGCYMPPEWRKAGKKTSSKSKPKNSVSKP